MSETDDPRTRLLEIDHESAVRIVDSSLKTLSVVRGWSVTVWLGLVAAALQLDNPWIAFLAIVPIAVFALYDGYVSWAYRIALEHARRVERVWQAAYDAAGRGASDEAVATDASAKTQAHRLGAILQFPRFRRPFIRKIVPAARFWIVYAILAASAVGIGLVLAFTGHKASKHAEGWLAVPLAATQSPSANKSGGWVIIPLPAGGLVTSSVALHGHLIFKLEGSVNVKSGARGPRGEPGQAGPTGPRGATGERGATGSRGSTGRIGRRGPRGSRGRPGPKSDP
jgi:hypothetical protein